MSDLSILLKKNKLLLVALLVAAARLISIDQSLWHDEAITALAARDHGFSGILSEFIVQDNHSPLYYLLLRFWGLMFGFGDTTLRLLSVSIGALTVYVFYSMAKLIEKNDKWVTFMVLLLSLSAFHVYYSQEVRMYVLSTFFTVVSVYFYLKIIRIKGKKFNNYFMYFGLAITALMFSDYVPVFFLPVFYLYALYEKKSKSWWKCFLISHIPLFVLSVFWAPIFFAQIDNYREVLGNLPLWSSVVGGASIRQLVIFWMKLILGRISLVDSIYYPLIVATSIPYVILIFNSLRRRNVFYLLWFFIPILLGLIVSIIFPAFNYFRFLYVVPAFYILLVKGAKKLSYGKVLLTLVLLINLLGLSIYYLDESQHREDWRSAVKTIEEKAGNDDAAIVFNYYLIPAGFRWYSEGFTDTYDLSSEKSLTGIMESYDSLYYFDYLEDIYDPDNSVKTRLSSTFDEEEIFDFRGVGQVRYYLRQ